MAEASAALPDPRWATRILAPLTRSEAGFRGPRRRLKSVIPQRRMSIVCLTNWAASRPAALRHPSRGSGGRRRPFPGPRASAPRLPAAAVAGSSSSATSTTRAPAASATAVEAQGPRTVVFRVGGLITLRQHGRDRGALPDDRRPDGARRRHLLPGPGGRDPDPRRGRAPPALPARRHLRRGGRRAHGGERGPPCGPRPLLGRLVGGREPLAEQRRGRCHRPVVPDRGGPEPQRPPQGPSRLRLPGAGHRRGHAPPQPLGPQRGAQPAPRRRLRPAALAALRRAQQRDLRLRRDRERHDRRQPARELRRQLRPARAVQRHEARGHRPHRHRGRELPRGGQRRRGPAGAHRRQPAALRPRRGGRAPARHALRRPVRHAARPHDRRGRRPCGRSWPGSAPRGPAATPSTPGSSARSSRAPAGSSTRSRRSAAGRPTPPARRPPTRTPTACRTTGSARTGSTRPTPPTARAPAATATRTWRST